jgi:hypothetical protein
VTHRERPLCSERSLRAVARVGQAVNLAVERFVTVGETIADDNPEIKEDMYEACKEARAAGRYLCKQTQSCMHSSLKTHKINTYGMYYLSILLLICRFCSQTTVVLSRFGIWMYTVNCWANFILLLLDQ